MKEQRDRLLIDSKKQIELEKDISVAVYDALVSGELV